MASSSFIGNYSPESVVVTIAKGNFVHQVTGFAYGTFLSAERLVPSSTPYIGSDLTGGRVMRRNHSMNVTLTLHSLASSNLVLQSLQQADADADSNQWIFSMTIKDLSGQTLIFSDQCCIQAPPTKSFSTEVDSLDWAIFMFNGEARIGGNTVLGEAEIQAIEATGAISIEDSWRA